MPIFSPGDRILVAHRRLYETDAPRYFLGTVSEYDSGVLKLVGKSFLYDNATGRVFKKEDERTKVYSVASGTVIIYQLPTHVMFEQLEFEGISGSLMLTDREHYHMDLTEEFQNMPEASSRRRWRLATL